MYCVFFLQPVDRMSLAVPLGGGVCLRHGAVMVKLTVWTAVMSSSATPSVDLEWCPASAVTSVCTTSSSVMGRHTAETPPMKALTTAVRYFRWKTLLSSHFVSMKVKYVSLFSRIYLDTSLSWQLLM